MHPPEFPVSEAAPRCPACGAAIPAGAADGLCAACLVATLLGGEEETVSGKIGGHELLEILGRGGMGTVWRARQIQAGREVALKMISLPRALDPMAERRFRSEIEAAAGLEHPNLVPVYEVGEADGILFYTMKWMRGGPLHGEAGAALRRQGWRALAAAMEKIARGVAWAHDHGVLHRVLKPANILVDERGDPAVGDFGLAKMMASRAEDAASLTQSGEFTGTPPFMAPELLSSVKAPVTTAADVYGLGAVFYWLLTDRAPFDGPTPAAILRAVVEDEPVRPSARCPNLPRDLELICLHSMEKQPARRYASATAFADDLARFLRGAAVLPAPVAPLVRTDLDTCVVIPAGTATYSISAAGSYVLMGNITVSTGNGITISADDVTLDLNGFTIASTAATNGGAGVTSGNLILSQINIRNGGIASGVTYNGTTFTNVGFDDGIRLSQCTNVSIENVRVTGVRSNGIFAGSSPENGVMVRGCQTYITGSDGISGTTVSDCTAAVAGNTGIRGIVVSRCNGVGMGTGSFSAGIDAAVVEASYGKGARFGILALRGTVTGSNGDGSTVSGIKAATVSNSSGDGGDSGIDGSSIMNSYGTSFGTGLTGRVVTNSYGFRNTSGGTTFGISAFIANGSRGEDTTFNASQSIQFKYNMP